MRSSVMVGFLFCAGCVPPAIEPLPALETCRLELGEVLAPSKATLQLGRLTDRGFAPLGLKAQVEVSLAPGGATPSWYALVAARTQLDGVTGDSLCLRLDAAVAEGLLDEQTGLVARRSESGWWTVPLAPMVVRNGSITTTGAAPAFDGWVQVGGGHVRVEAVNHEGFLSTPGEVVQPRPDLVVLPALDTSRLLPGEGTDVRLMVGGDLAAVGDVELVAEAPDDVSVTLASTTPPTTGRLEVSPTAPPGPRSVKFRLLTALGEVSNTLSFEVRAPSSPMVLLRVPTTVQADGGVSEVPVRLVPLGGLSGPVTLKALVNEFTEVTLPTTTLDLQGPVEVRAHVQAKGGDATTVRFVVVRGRERWEAPVQVVASRGVLDFIFSPGSERRLITRNRPFDWYLVTSPFLQLVAPPPPPGCTVLTRTSSLRFACDTSFRGAVSMVAGARTAAGVVATTELRLVGVGDAIHISAAPSFELREDSAGALAVLTRGDGSRQTLVSDAGLDAGLSAGIEAFQLGEPDGGTALLTRQEGVLSLAGTPLLSDARGPVVTATDLDGTQWVASWTSAQTPELLSRSPGAIPWVQHVFTSGAAATDLALAARHGVVVFGAVEAGVALVRLLSGGRWSTLPPPPGEVPRAVRRSRPDERLFDVALDANDRPVTAFVGTDEQLHVLRFEGPGWAVMAELSPAAGRLPLEVSLAANSAGELALAWTEGSHVLLATSAQRVQPVHLASAAVRWGRFGAAFTELPPPMLDPDRGTPEQPRVVMREAGRAVVGWLENGEVVLREQ